MPPKNNEAQVVSTAHAIALLVSVLGSIRSLMDNPTAVPRMPSRK
jgi:hypothetical protein